MIIQADKEGKKLIGQLCNIAVKQSSQEMSRIFNSIEPLPEPEPEKPEEKQDETPIEEG